MRKKVVFVGLSGGVDSAVSAALLSAEGGSASGGKKYDVVGVFIKTWHPDFLSCNEEEERRDAMRVAAHLKIPFLTFDFEDVYKKEVADYMISEYKAGKTPNPDVMCNKHVKFGAFLKKAVSMGALVRPLAETFIATGHYAQIADSLQLIVDRKNTKLKAKSYTLKANSDPTKDQSYFLWTLKQEQLKRILFPIGHLKKTEVRKLAKKFRLPVAEKKDSQGICFLGAIDLKEFLKHYIKSKKGKVVNENGETIGHHEGVVFYTLGERHGFTITKKSSTDGAYYIVGKDVKKNILFVSQKRYFLPDKGGAKRVEFKQPLPTSPYQGRLEIYLENTNWILARQFKGGSEVPSPNKTYTAQIRYHGEFLPCKIKCPTPSVGQVVFKKPVLVASGQSCVIYDNDICLGGGVVI